MTDQIPDFQKWLNSVLSVQPANGGRDHVLLHIVKYPLGLTREQALCLADRIRELALPIPTCAEFFSGEWTTSVDERGRLRE